MSAERTKELVRSSNNFLVPVDSFELSTRRVQSRGAFDEGMDWVIRRYVIPGTVAVDVGANLGFLALPMAERLGVNGRLIALEPNADLHRYFVRLMHLNAIENVTLLSIGCSDKDSMKRFSIDDRDHSMSKISDEGAVEIETRSLDSILADCDKRVSFIKIDVEGHEAAVLRGAIGTLERHRPTLVFESGLYSAAEVAAIQAVLDASRYEVIGVINEDGIASMPLGVRMTEDSHCNVLALPKQRSSDS